MPPFPPPATPPDRALEILSRGVSFVKVPATTHGAEPVVAAAILATRTGRGQWWAGGWTRPPDWTYSDGGGGTGKGPQACDSQSTAVPAGRPGAHAERVAGRGGRA